MKVKELIAALDAFPDAEVFIVGVDRVAYETLRRPTVVMKTDPDRPGPQQAAFLEAGALTEWFKRKDKAS